jgi:hypothetical protein
MGVGVWELNDLPLGPGLVGPGGPKERETVFK